MCGRGQLRDDAKSETTDNGHLLLVIVAHQREIFMPPTVSAGESSLQQHVHLNMWHTYEVF